MNMHENYYKKISLYLIFDINKTKVCLVSLYMREHPDGYMVVKLVGYGTKTYFTTNSVYEYRNQAIKFKINVLYSGF